MTDLTTIDGVKALMASSTSEDEWNSNCTAVKKANGGGYPDFWYREIVMSGLMSKVVATPREIAAALAADVAKAMGDPGWYILDDKHQPVPCDADAWAEWRSAASIRVNRTAIDVTGLGTIVVSTVFLGVDHNFSGIGLPVLFETMVFRNGDGQEQVRYETWDQAERGHAAMVAEVKQGLARLAQQAANG